ncbi:MAG: efflux RND transporter periplasmic adaptor subunit, partial [Armatimonadota bacterium]|nr:efflux RND transporter periplasmic adaptor subunit [Armatimonadota bacterium]
MMRLGGSLLLLLLVALSGCAQPTASQVAGPHAPPDLQRGPTPPGGPSADITGGGAGGSGAAGVQF